MTVRGDAGDVHAAEVPGVVDVHRDDDDLGIEKLHRGFADDGRDARQRKR